MEHPLFNEIKIKLEFICQQIDDLKTGTKKKLSLKEAAKYLGIEKSTLYKLTSEGKIAYYKPHGKLINFDKDDLDIWNNKGRVPANHEL